jgi:hypothetical protein
MGVLGRVPINGESATHVTSKANFPAHKCMVYNILPLKWVLRHTRTQIGSNFLLTKEEPQGEELKKCEQ